MPPKKDVFVSGNRFRRHQTRCHPKRFLSYNTRRPGRIRLLGNNDVSTHRTAHKAPPYALP
ncbi:hypothetical protein ACR30T_06765 [Neisseria gonorrhoeae]